jgi:ankyrin repeat protein
MDFKKLVIILFLAGANLSCAMENDLFFESIKTGNYYLVDKLIKEKKADPNAQKNGKSALMWAIESKKPWMIIILINLGADINKAAKNGETPLSFAAIYYPRAMRTIEDSHKKIKIPSLYKNYIEYKKALLKRGQEILKKESRNFYNYLLQSIFLI